jgi:hypothetical protein
MDSQILMRLNEIYRHNVYNEEVLSEETLSEEELVGIEEWVEALIEEGYDLDQFSDEELYEAYLSALDEAKMDKGKTDVEKRVTRKERLVSGGNLSPGMQSKYNSPKYTPEDSDDEIEVGRQWAHRRSRGMKKPEAKSRPTHSGKYGAMQRRRGMNEELDLYDIVSEYLVSEGFCDSYDDADVIMANMSEEWRESIMEEVLDERLTGLRVRRAVTKFQDQNERPDQYKKPSANKNPRPNYTLGAVATHKEGSPNPYNPSTPEDYKDSGNRPTKRGGRGKKGEPKTGYYGTDKRDSDRGSGNAAKRRASGR